jgi:hypothetical protein
MVSRKVSGGSKGSSDSELKAQLAGGIAWNEHEDWGEKSNVTM